MNGSFFQLWRPRNLFVSIVFAFLVPVAFVGQSIHGECHVAGSVNSSSLSIDNNVSLTGVRHAHFQAAASLVYYLSIYTFVTVAVCAFVNAFVLYGLQRLLKVAWWTLQTSKCSRRRRAWAPSEHIFSWASQRLSFSWFPPLKRFVFDWKDEMWHISSAWLSRHQTLGSSQLPWRWFTM